MRYYQFQPNTETQLDEVRMGSSDFAKFLKTPLAKQMQAGFEAELIFRGLGEPEEGDLEPDWDEDRRARSIDNIIDFFESGDFSTMTPREAERTRNSLYEDYMEYNDELMYSSFRENRFEIIEEYIRDNVDLDETIDDLLRDNEDLSDKEIEELYNLESEYRKFSSSREQRAFLEEHPELKQLLRARETALEGAVEMAIEDQDDNYENALEEFRDNWDGVDEEQWLDDRGWSYMSDVYAHFGLDWPHYTSGYGSEGGFNEAEAENLADSLSETLGVDTTVSSGYHSATRDESTWIFEPDSSLEPDDGDDMPVEIVSPPMPLEQTARIIPKFFEWAKRNGAYSNDSTGFHISVSMPDHEETDLDYTKLALFLGDEYVLKKFGRIANTYARSAIDKIKSRAPRDPAQLAEYMNKMSEGINKLAKDSLASYSGFGKYTSINPKSGYVEFRSAGGENYMDDLKDLQDTVARYGMALSIAMDPEAEKQEYAKKLYKLLSPGAEGEEDVISLFSRYSAKELPVSALKSYLKNIQYKRDVKKNMQQDGRDEAGRLEVMPELNHRNPNYEIYNVDSNNSVYSFRADNTDDALQALSIWRASVMHRSLDPSKFWVRGVAPNPVGDDDLPFNVTYSIGDTGRQNRSNYRVDARNQAEARQKFLQMASRTINLDRITIHDVQQLG